MARVKYASALKDGSLMICNEPIEMITYNTSLTSIVNDISNAIAKSASDIHRNAIASISGGTSDVKKKVENLYVLPNENYEVVDFSKMGVIEENTNILPQFIEGEKYSLQGVACDGFEMPTKTYELVGMVDDFHGVNVDYVIMKQLSGERGQVYTFSKNDCAQLGIEYQEGLQPFPKNMHWKRVKEKIEFNPKDLSTTPRSEIDNSIRYVLLKLNGFKDYSDGYVLSPSGKLIKEEQFEKSLRVINNEPIVYGNGFIIGDKTKLNAQIAYPNGLLYTHANFISQDDTVYILLTFKHTLSKNTYNKRVEFEKYIKNCVDDGFGIEPQYLSNIDPHALFTVAWDELGALTIEEYNEAKEKAKKKALERAKREEEARKKSIEEEEIRAKEAEKRRIAAVERMKKSMATMGSFPTAPRLSFKTENVATMDMYTTSMSRYFGELDKTLNALGKDLDIMFSKSNNDASLRKILNI